MTIWTKQSVLELLNKSNEAVERALLAMCDRQTWDEQNSHNTKEINGIGFNKMDADILTSFAKQIRTRGPLTEKQLNVARRRLPKYANQLVEIANEKEKQKWMMEQKQKEQMSQIPT